MEMASSEVEMSSCQTFNCVLTRPHERCSREGDINNNNNNINNKNVRNIPVAFDKNLNVFVRDHLDGDDSTKAVPECSSNKSSISDHWLLKTEEFRHEVPSLPALGSDPDPNFGQPENPSKNETMAASSLVQIWEARTTQQPPSSSQNQFQIDNRTASTGTNLSEHSESPNHDSVKESEFIQPIEEGSNEEEEKEEMECDSQFVPLPPELGEKDREGVRVMDIIRKLSNDPEIMTNNDNGSNSNDNGKEVQTTEARCFPQVACSPRIRGRQALADLLEQMTRDREKELACIAERHSVSKFTHRGRIQSTLRIRCYERCIAIQECHRAKSSAAGSDLNRSPQGSGVMHLLREKKYKANTENIGTGALSSTVSSWGRIVDKDPHKATEKKVLQEPKEKSGLKESQEVNSAVETAKKAVLSEIAENKNISKKSAEETNQKETNKGRAEKRESKDKPLTKESSEGKGERQELTKEKAVAKKSVEGNAMVGVAEKLNLWNSEEKMNRRNGMEKGKNEGKANTDRVEKNVVLEEATRRIINIESAERSITNISRENMTTPFEFTEKVRRKNNENVVSVEFKSKAIEDSHINPQRVTAQADSCLRKQSSEKTVLQGKMAKSDLKKPIEKESREESREIEKSVKEGPLMMGIAEKVILWNSKEKKNRRRAMEQDKGKIEGKSNIDTNEVLQEASRRISNVETAERSDVTSREVVENVVGNKEIMDRRESSGNIKQCEYVEKGRKNKDEDIACVEAKSKEVVEAKNMNPHAANKVGDYEQNSSQHREEKSVLRNSEAKSSKEIVRNNSQEVIQKEDSASHGNRERDKEKSSSQHSEERSVLRNSKAKIVRNTSQEVTQKEEPGSHSSGERDKEKSSSQHSEERSVLRNSKAKIVRNTSQEVTQKEEPGCHGSGERDKEKSSSQYGEKLLIQQNSEAKSTKVIERSNSQEVSHEEKSASEVSRESAKEKYTSQQDDEVSILRNPNDQKSGKKLEDEETKKVERKETEENKNEETLGFVNDDWDENEMEEDEYEDYDPFYGENMDDWIHDISRPRSYWEDLRKERYLEVLSSQSEKNDICKLIERRTVSNFLMSDFRQKIDNLMISRVQGHVGVQIDQGNEEEDEEVEEWGVECSARNDDNNEIEEETLEKTNLETASDVCSQSSARSSTIMSWTFKDHDIDKDHEPTTSLSLPEPLIPTNQSTQETQETSDLRSQIEQLQREVLELRSAVKTCIDMQLQFQKSISQDASRSGSSAQQVDTTKDLLKRKCCVCSEMPVDSLLYRCGHMCTCLKCAHELQWSSKKCPICMAPIVDVVRAFLDS